MKKPQWEPFKTENGYCYFKAAGTKVVQKRKLGTQIGAKYLIGPKVFTNFKDAKFYEDNYSW